VDILMLDIVVIVVPAVEIITEVRMLESVSMSWMAVSSRLELMKLVCDIGRKANKAC
jgi:hypothetical protein